MTYRNKDLRESARGEACTMRGPTCTGGGEDTCWRHSNEIRHGKATGQKADDIFGCYACQQCEWLYDGTNSLGVSIEERRKLFARAMAESLAIAVGKGVEL